MIIGPSQSGKTTLANQLIHKLHKQNNYIVIAIEAGPLANATEANVINLIFKSTKENLKKELSRLNLNQLINELDKICCESLPNTWYEFSEYLDAIYETLHNIHQIVLVIDEIEVLSDPLLYNFLSLFRSLANKNLGREKGPYFSMVILCQQDLSAFDLGKGSPYNIKVTTRRINDFTFTEFQEMLDQDHAGSIIGKIFNEEAASLIFNETSGHPFLIQRICQLAIDIMHEQHYEKIDEKIVIETMIVLFEKGNRHLRIIYNDAPQDNDQKEIILRILRGIPEPFERILPAHRYLEDKGVIKEDKTHKLCRFRTKIYERLFLS